MKELSNTKVTVRLRKIEGRKEWYVYIESYPVLVPGKKSPQITSRHRTAADRS